MVIRNDDSDASSNFIKTHYVFFEFSNICMKQMLSRLMFLRNISMLYEFMKDLFEKTPVFSPGDACGTACLRTRNQTSNPTLNPTPPETDKSKTKYNTKLLPNWTPKWKPKCYIRGCMSATRPIMKSRPLP